MQAPNKIYIQPRAHDGWFENNPNESFVEYIRKDAIVAEVERMTKESVEHSDGSLYYGGRVGAFSAVLSAIESL